VAEPFALTASLREKHLALGHILPRWRANPRARVGVGVGCFFVYFAAARRFSCAFAQCV